MNDAERATTRGWRSWEAKIRGRKLAVMWAMSAIGGAMLISLTMGIGISSHATGLKEADKPLFVFLRLSIPVVIMAFYARYGYQYADSAREYVALRRARLGQLADSLYFLGFLWTLWALIDAFVIHQMSIAEAVFRAFGYALVTTATGMFLRLLLLQFGYSGEDIVPLAEVTLEEEIARFTKEVSRAVKSISGFRTQTDTALTGWIASLNKSTGALKTAVADVNAQTDDLKGALVEMHQASAEHLDKLVETALGQFTKKVEPSLEALNNTNRQFVTQVNASATTLKHQLDASTAKLTQGLDSTTAKVEAAVGAGVKNIEAGVHEGTKRVQSELSRGADAISTSLEKSTQTIDRAATKFATTLSTQMVNLESNLANVSKQIREIRVPPDIVEKTMAQQSATVNASLVASTRALQDAIDTLRRSVLTVAEQVRYWRRPRWKFWA